jgi:hypothetical protein
MWSYLTTRSFINPVPGYVENEAGDAETRFMLDEMTFRLVRLNRIARFVRVRHTGVESQFCARGTGLRTLAG